ncbi:MAG: hypothetical protein U0T84_10335 [Chitinophagales bacterium]
MEDLLPNWPEESRVWIYAANRELSAQEESMINSRLADFAAGWQSHGEPVHAKATVYLNRFLLFVAAPTVAMGGCSIDKSVQLVQQLTQTTGINFFDRMFTWVLVAGVDAGEKQWKGFDRNALQEAINNGEVSADTVVFNPLVSTLGELRKQRFVLIKNAWQRQLFTSPVNS